jgi:hypothetical protein
MTAKSNKFTAAMKDGPTIAASAPRQASPSRGAKHIGGYFTPEVSRQLRMIAASEDTSIQNLLAESLDMLFHSRQMPTIAQNPASQ